jgi:hypothetical protein
LVGTLSRIDPCATGLRTGITIFVITNVGQAPTMYDYSWIVSTKSVELLMSLY